MVVYEDSVILDSGATDHMVPSSHYVTDVSPAYSQALLPDNTVLAVTEQGTLRVSVYDQLRRRRWVIPLLHTLVVEGIRKILWSVPQFTKQGHRIIFEGDIVKLILNATGPREGRLVLHIAHPYLRQTSGPTSHSIQANAVTRARARRDAQSQQSQGTQDWFTDSQADLSTQTVLEIDESEDDHFSTDDGPRPLRLVEPPAAHRTRVPLETLHSRLGHAANRGFAGRQ